VEIVEAESWDGKTGAPNVSTSSDLQPTAEDARMVIQRKIATITMTSDNHLEWISWKTDSVEVKFWYTGNSEGLKVHQTKVMSIMEIDEYGKTSYAHVGD
jgi:hypothetical protein